MAIIDLLVIYLNTESQSSLAMLITQREKHTDLKWVEGSVPMAHCDPKLSYPFTAPWVRPKIKDFLNITATIAGGKIAMIPAAAVIPY